MQSESNKQLNHPYLCLISDEDSRFSNQIIVNDFCFHISFFISNTDIGNKKLV